MKSSKIATFFSGAGGAATSRRRISYPAISYPGKDQSTKCLGSKLTSSHDLISQYPINVFDVCRSLESTEKGQLILVVRTSGAWFISTWCA